MAPKNLRQVTSRELESLKPFLEEWTRKTEQPSYIEKDPVLFMHAFNKKEDQLLAGFFAALFAWGRRDIVISKTRELMDLMDNKPFAFIRSFTEKESERFSNFKHRTFKPVDIYWLVKILHQILQKHQTFENFWKYCYKVSVKNNRELIAVFHEEFFSVDPRVATRTRKHLSNPEKNSSSKRLYLYLRWSIRTDSEVDLGLMDFMPPSELKIPLDVHVARQARKLGLLTRTYNDWKAVTELTARLQKMAPRDPVKYDYALFGLGVNKETIPDKFVKNPRYQEN